jgi:enterochelin esterase-like enzyme
VSHDAARTIVGGASLGGVAAAFAALHRPDLFRRVLAQSGAFWLAGDDGEHEWLARQFAARPAVPIRFYLDVGLRETVPAPGDGPSNLIANRHLRTVLRAKSYDVHYAEFNGGHNFIAWQGTLSDGLMAVLRTDAGPSRA